MPNEVSFSGKYSERKFSNFDSDKKEPSEQNEDDHILENSLSDKEDFQTKKNSPFFKKIKKNFLLFLTIIILLFTYYIYLKVK